MKLYLLRHGKTELIVTDDKVRNLLPKGIAQSKTIGQFLTDQKVIFDVIFCSNANRTLGTLEALKTSFTCDTKVVLSSDLYLASSVSLLKFLTQNTSSDQKNILLIGHNEGISELAIFLTDQNVQLKTGELIVLDLGNTKFVEADYGCAKVLNRVRMNSF